MQMGCGGRESEVRSAEGKSPEGNSPEGESQKCGGRNTNLNINPLDLRPGGVLIILLLFRSRYHQVVMSYTYAEYRFLIDCLILRN